MTFDDCKNFCLEWGFDVESDRDNDLPYSVYPKMTKDADNRYGKNFSKFMSQITNTNDNHTYVCAYSWTELEQLFNHIMGNSP